MSDHVESDAHAENTQSCHVHIVPVKVLVGVFLALVVLTVITVEAAKYDTGALDVIVSMAIATVKASLVVFIFMHLWYDKPLNKLAFFFSIVFAAFFLCMILLDSHAYDNYVKGFTEDKTPEFLVKEPEAAAPAAAPAAATDAKPAADTKAAPAEKPADEKKPAASEKPETDKKTTPETIDKTDSK
ncbi:MAG: cytochrome C oxidase subunit IV family protein [Planctomycetaceae bacterium]|nr:cytochrome C oxidase subunit IV family protein [Planctomycetaceae bacterium]